MKKKCTYCGRQLPDSASFCPFCARSLIEKREVKIPDMRGRHIAEGIGALLLLTAVAAGVTLLLRRSLRTVPAEKAPQLMAQTETTAPEPEPEPESTQPEQPEQLEHSAEVYDNGTAEIAYTDEDGTWHLLLTFSHDAQVAKTPTPSESDCIPDGVHFAKPSQLHVYRDDTDENVSEQFMQKVSKCTVETIPEAGASAMTHTDVRYNESFPAAARMTDIRYQSDCGTNEILWTISMKNGDTVRLRQTIAITRREQAVYHYSDYPMETMEQLKVLLAQIEADVGREVSVILELPPVTYTGDLNFAARTYSLRGSRSDTGSTTFTGAVSIQTQSPDPMEIQGITFAGNGGTGLTTNRFVTLDGCTFTGWDIGTTAEDGGWLSIYNCLFQKNKVGIKFNTAYSSGSSEDYPSNRFYDNETAVLFEKLYGTKVINFGDCTFSGNQIDVSNPAEHPIDLSGAIFK